MRSLWLALLLAAPAAAQRVGEVGFTVDQWGGLDTQHDSARISDFDAQGAENVLTDRGRLEKRTGNVRLTTILAGYPIKALREFVPGSLTRYVIAHAGDTVYQTDLSGTVTALSSVTANANVDMIQGLNTLLVQDGQRTPWTWNAVSTASVGTVPICKFIEYANERVYCGNLPSQSTSRVAVSSYGSVSWFTVPANVASVAEAPNTFDFQREDGDVITCLKATRCGVFVGKSRSTHIIKGYDNFTFRKDVISENIGCQDDRTVQNVDGNIVWLGQDAVYSWPCAGKPEAISRDIDPIIKALRQGNSFSASWVLNTQGEFEAGNLTASGAGAPMSSTIESGSVVASTSVRVDTSSSDFAGGTLANTSITDVAGSVLLSSSVYEDTWAVSAGTDTTAGRLAWVNTFPNAPSSFGKFKWGGAVGLTPGTTAGINTENATYDCRFDVGSQCVIRSSSFTIANGSWKFQHAFQDESGNTMKCAQSVPGTQCFEFRFMKNNVGNYLSAALYTTGNDESAKLIKLTKTIYGVTTPLTQVSYAYGLHQVFHDWEIVRTPTGVMYLYIDGVQISSTPAEVSVSSSIAVEIAAHAQAFAPYEWNIFKNVRAYSYAPTGSITSRIFDTSFSTPTWGAISGTVTFTGASPEGNVAYYVQSSTASDGGGFTSLVSDSDTIRLSTLAQKRYFRYRADFQTLSSTNTPRLEEISLAAVTTGYYISPIKFVGTAISAYGALDMLESIPSGSSITYEVREGTYSFPANTTSIAWTALNNHATVSLAISTPTYFQYRALLLPVSGDHFVALQRSQLSWNEGAISPPPASGWKDGRYFLCGTLSATATYPDICLIYQRNKKWTTFTGFSAASMANYNRDIIVGSGGTDGYVWKILQNDVYNDDGAVIASTWTSKDFMFAPNGKDWAVGNKTINEVWLDTEVSTSTYLTVGYAVNKSTTYLSGILDLGAWGDSVNKMIPFTTTNQGKYMRVRLFNGDRDRNLKINGYSIYGEPQPKTTD